MVQFKLAQQEDLEKIVGTYNASIPARMATADLTTVTIESRQKWFDEHNAEKRPLWVITYDNEYAGWISFSNFYGRPAYDATIEVSIYLEDSFHGKGIGKTVLIFAEEQAKTRNINTLLGFIFGHNAASLQLFNKQGYNKWAQLPEVANMDGILRDLIIVGKKLN